MASPSIYSYDQPITVTRSSKSAEAWQAIRVRIGDFSVSLSREEAAHLAADLLNAADATPIDAEVTA